jgi:hypothetical protein
MESERGEISRPEDAISKEFTRTHCMVCAKEGAFEGGICDLCKAKIRGEALEGQHHLKKEADKSLHKEGLVIEKKTHG